ncbi:MAG: thioesterase [Desulfobacterales bacterium]|nr:thioesterase [Desulfobacterales bacterium]
MTETIKKNNPWPSKPEKINLFCLPFAGGNSYSYREFENYTAGFINAIPVDLPGHGKFIGQPLLTSVSEMVDNVFNQVRKFLNQPYAIYGHSMGTLLGYLLSVKIIKAKVPKPVHLFFSGRYAPTIESREKNFHLLPREEFIKKVMAYGGIPKQVAREKDLMDLFVPIMKADFQATSTYKYEEAEPFDIPIKVMIGDNDNATYDEAMRWQEVTTRKIFVTQFTGGHFFIFDHMQEICRIISESLEKEALTKLS